MIWRRFPSRSGPMSTVIRASSRTCWGPSWKARKDAVRIRQESLLSHTRLPARVLEKAVREIGASLPDTQMGNYPTGELKARESPEQAAGEKSSRAFRSRIHPRES